MIIIALKDHIRSNVVGAGLHGRFVDFERTRLIVSENVLKAYRHNYGIIVSVILNTIFVSTFLNLGATFFLTQNPQ